MVRPTTSLSNATCGCLTLTNPVGIYLGSHLVVYERASTASKATLLCTVIVSNHTGLTVGIWVANTSARANKGFVWGANMATDI